MVVLGFLGSPRLQGRCSKLLAKALDGAANAGAETKRYDLIRLNIQHCQGCFKCVFEHHDLPVGKCPLKDDMAAILDEYVKADGYIFASPVYESNVTSLMKKFLERKIALGFRDKNEYGKIPFPRSPAAFKKMASMIIVGNCGDEFREVMGDPCFEALESHLLIEQVPTVDRYYVGGVENMSDDTFAVQLEEAFQLGKKLVEEIRKAQ